MRISTLACGLLCAALAWAGPAAAQRGPGVEEAGEEQRFVPAGLVLNPTAYMLPANQWLIGAGTFQQAVVTGSSDRQDRPASSEASTVTSTPGCSGPA